MKKQSNEYENIRGKDMRLPIGIQTFSEMRDNYYYVDKTKYIYDLISKIGKFFFLSRPRRFGKSLLIDTMKELFSGNKELFKDLYIYDKWDWDDKYPVIKISFGSGSIISVDDLIIRITNILNQIIDQQNIEIDLTGNIREDFIFLIHKLNKEYNSQVVVLIDEYDKPILDTIDNIEICLQVREELKNFYSVLKGESEFIRFCFLTGVSKFSKVSIFSGLNNLYDITLSKKFSAICGYTQHDLETVFKDRFDELSSTEKFKVQKWYNGYNWTGESVYNPFDILLYLEERRLESYWFETGTPTSLVKLILKNKYNLSQLDGLEVTSHFINDFNITNLSPESYFFQTGYLTIKDSYILPTDDIIYIIGFPNKEVQKSFNKLMLNTFVDNINYNINMGKNLINSIINCDLELMNQAFHTLFAGIPSDWYRKNNISEYEGFYASVFYSAFAAYGFDIIPEDSTNHGKIDMTVIYQGICYIFEFKVNEYCEQGNALQQIKHKKYYEKYQNRDDVNKTYIVGVEFSKDDKNITNFEYEEM